MFLNAREEVLQVKIEHEAMIHMLLRTGHNAPTLYEANGVIVGGVHSLQHLVDIGQKRHQATCGCIYVSHFAGLLEDGEMLVSSAYVVRVAVPS